MTTEGELHAATLLVQEMKRLECERNEARTEGERLKVRNLHMIDALGDMTERCCKAEEKVERLQSEYERLTLLAELNTSAMLRWHELAEQLQRIINKPPVYGYVPTYERENLAELEAKHKAEREAENERLMEWARKRRADAE